MLEYNINNNLKNIIQKYYSSRISRENENEREERERETEYLKQKEAIFKN